jgi:dienelactone hydrolase
MTALFRDQTIIFADGASGAHVDIPTADPVNYHQAISAPETMTRTVIDAKLFLPGDRRAGEKLPAVIVVPGSAGVSANHLRHAETIVSLGAAVLVIDPFGARGVTSTIANQVQYSFAASAYDVLAGARVLAGMPEIDASRIGAHGHSRGGSAVVSAAMRRFAVPVMGRSPCLRAVFAAYPWSGHQFLDPDIGGTLLRAMIGDRDGWCLPQQVQGHIQAIRLRGGDASLRIVADAAHSFDRETPVEMIANAAVAPGAPTAYIAGDGAFIHPVEGRPDPSLTDRDIMIYAMKAGYGVKGATMGGKPGQPELFRDEIVRFWRRVLWETPR